MIHWIRSIRILLVSIVTMAGIAGCRPDSATCQGPVVSHPDGRCSAYYHQSDFGSGGAVTQASVSCSISPGNPGGGVAAFQNTKYGMGLRWIDGHTLEIAVPDGVRLEEKRIGDTYNGYVLRYVYRSLQPNEPAYHGCGI